MFFLLYFDAPSFPKKSAPPLQNPGSAYVKGGYIIELFVGQSDVKFSGLL